MSKTRTRWTAALVADHIRAIRASGVVPSHSYVLKHHLDLYGAALCFCGGFRRALIAAGEDPQAIAMSSRSRSSATKTKWTRAKILSTLKDRHGAGLQINVGAVNRDGLWGLCRAASREFGSYGGAVEAAGFRYEAVRLIAPDWTPEAVLRSISLLGEKGIELNVSAVQHKQSSLVALAIKFFGSCDVALREAGFDPKIIRLGYAHGGWQRPALR